MKNEMQKEIEAIKSIIQEKQIDAETLIKNMGRIEYHLEAIETLIKVF